MSTFKTLTSAVLIGATALTFSVPAISAPMINQAPLAASVPTATENVQYYGGGGPRRGYGYGGGYRGRGYGRGGGGNGALIGGLAAGAIIGGVIAAGAANQANAAAQQNYDYCSQRYRSYDPRSGTYLNNDGNRYPCP
ncbi:BA14K family protein [Tardiphaga sp.]|uniref:BA14K family protein n=1 Tax=Tardiphaga sp. TaxID=1926292 RepID=UPI002619688C|nr:BA14K family protein [Tardiphaga sp.]MDB5618109.1 hypothetical protein [Tardiphaga sp.]